MMEMIDMIEMKKMKNKHLAYKLAVIHTAGLTQQQRDCDNSSI